MSASALALVAAKLLLRPRDVDWEKNREVVFHADYSRFADVDGVRVHYQEAGRSDAPPMILIHGFASSNLVWSKVLLELAGAGFQSYRSRPAWLWLLGKTSRTRLHDRFASPHDCWFDKATGNRARSNRRQFLRRRSSGDDCARPSRAGGKTGVWLEPSRIMRPHDIC